MQEEKQCQEVRKKFFSFFFYNCQSYVDIYFYFSYSLYSFLFSLLFSSLLFSSLLSSLLFYFFVQHTSIVFDPFMYLSLPLSSPSSSSSSSASSRASSRARSIGSEKTITLEQALYNFTAEEELGEDNEWFCPKCKEQKQAYKKLDIWRLPEVLILHLKRFNQGKYRRSKLECAVEFPMTGLDMTSYVVETSPHRQDNNIYGA